MPVAVVTDSSGMLPADHTGLTVVPLQVIIGEHVLDEGAEGAGPAEVLAALAAKKSVSTSRPAPAVLAATYRALAKAGATAIVSVHLSGELSGTCESARLAARDVSVPVDVVDTRAVGPCVGFAALAAASVAAAGGSAEEVAEAAMERADASRSYFYVDSLDFLRRGGRIGSAAALLGSAFAVKPLLAIADGRVVAHERVRTSARALARLEALAVEAAGESDVEICVAHLGAEERAADLVAALAEKVPTASMRCGEIGAAVGAHVGPGLIAVCVAPAL